MPIPVGALTATVTVGASGDVAGGAATVEEFVVRPVARLVWAATGETIEPWMTEPDATGSVEIVADQPGLLTSGTVDGVAALVAIRDCPMEAMWTLVRGTQRMRRAKRFTMPAPGVVLDLDLLPDAGAVPPASITYAQTLNVGAGSAEDVAQAVEDYLTANPPAAPVESVNGETGAVVLSAADVGAAASGHGHVIADTTGLQAALDGKQAAGSYAATTHTHAPADITGTAVTTTDPRLSDARTPTAHTHPASAISDSTATGRSLLTAADAAAARTAIGAGTSNLAIGTTGTTAAAGNRQATQTAIGMVELATTAEATTGTDTTRAVTPAGLKAVADTKAASSHTHASGDVSDFAEATQDVVGAMVAAAGGTYDDAAGTITLPSGGGGGGSTGTVQFVVGRAGASVDIAASTFTTYPLDGTPTVNIGGGSWDAGTYVYTVPSNGLYLCLGMVRLFDSAAERSTALAIGTTNADGPHVDWSVMGGSGSARSRSARQYTRLTRFTAGDQVRMYIYSDGATFTTHSSGGDAPGQYMSIIKLAD